MYLLCQLLVCPLPWMLQMCMLSLSRSHLLNTKMRRGCTENGIDWWGCHSNAPCNSAWPTNSQIMDSQIVSGERHNGQGCSLLSCII